MTSTLSADARCFTPLRDRLPGQLAFHTFVNRRKKDRYPTPECWNGRFACHGDLGNGDDPNPYCCGIRWITVKVRVEFDQSRCRHRDS